MTQAIGFAELLTATDSDLVRIFYNIKSDPKDDFIIRINRIAEQLDLNHSQLICALGFNRQIRELTDIQTILGFKSYRLLTYRNHELFKTDTYKQLSIDNVIDIYAEHLQDADIFNALRQLLKPRLDNIQTDLDQNDEPSLTISYRMEIHTIYTTGLGDQAFAESRLSEAIGNYRQLANEVNVIADNGLIPPSNMFFMDSLSIAEKVGLIKKNHINRSMIENRLKNVKISAEERDLLEDYI